MLSKIMPNIIFLSVILFIGCITSYEDFKTSKIRNKWIKAGLIYSLSVYLATWILYGLAAKGILSPIIGRAVSSLIWNFDKWCINLAISTVVAYLLWHFKMWGAGDAKLFIAYAALIPLGQYSKAYFNYYFASFLLLLSIFIPATGYLFIRASFNYLKRSSFKEIAEKISRLLKSKITKSKISETLKVLFGFVSFFLFYRLLRNEITGIVGKVLPGQNIIMLICLVAFRPLSKIFRKKNKYVLIFFILFAIYILVKTPASFEGYLLLIRGTFSKSLLVILLFPIINKIIILFEGNAINKTTPFAMWMFLGVLITWFI